MANQIFNHAELVLTQYGEPDQRIARVAYVWHDAKIVIEGLWPLDYVNDKRSFDQIGIGVIFPGKRAEDTHTPIPLKLSPPEPNGIVEVVFYWAGSSLVY